MAAGQPAVAMVMATIEHHTAMQLYLVSQFDFADFWTWN